MAANRVMSQSATTLLFGRRAMPIARNFAKRRTVTTPAAPSLNSEILTKQRLNRPVAPHLTIYKPQITWIGSSLHRVTGLLLSGPLYLWALAYLASPLTGWHLESATLAAGFAAWPVAAKVAAKFSLAMPFVYHSLNGLRHLGWDLALGIGKQQVIRTGWAVVGLSVLSSLYLAVY